MPKVQVEEVAKLCHALTHCLDSTNLQATPQNSLSNLTKANALADYLEPRSADLHAPYLSSLQSAFLPTAPPPSNLLLDIDGKPIARPEMAVRKDGSRLWQDAL